MNRTVLEQPFPAEVVKSRRGSRGHDLSYVEAHWYIRRLNEAFDGEWSWRIANHRVEGNEVVVLGVLVAGGIEKSAFGGSTITSSKTTGEVISIADDLKAAATDALKKAASLFGVGLDLYAGTAEPSEQRRPPNLRPVSTAASSGAPEPSRNNERNRLTANQLRALYAIAHGRGMSDGDLKRATVEKFGVVPEFMTRSDASTFIGHLSERGAS